MPQVLASGGIDPAHYAELHDRIRRNTKLAQSFGMATMEREGRRGFYPIHHEHDVDARREAIGLPPLRVFAHLSSIRYVRPSADAARAEADRRTTKARDLYAGALALLSRGNVESARQRFEEALEIYGALTDDDIYEFAARHAAALPRLPSADAKPIHAWLRLLVDRQWMGMGRLLFDRRFDPIRGSDEWRQLTDEVAGASQREPTEDHAAQPHQHGHEGPGQSVAGADTTGGVGPVQPTHDHADQPRHPGGDGPA
jgi:hypothetical protein